MKKYRKLFIILFIIFVFIVFLLYFVFINKGVQEDRFMHDLESYSNQNLLKEYKFSSSHVYGDYRDVEDEISNYIHKFQRKYQDVLAYADDRKLTSLLSVSNYVEDGPSFENSISYVEEVRNSFSNDIQELMDYGTQDCVEKYAKELPFSSYYQQLFVDGIVQSGVLDQLEGYHDTFLQSENQMNQIFNTTIQVFEFLKIHSNDWKIEDNEIQFSTNDLVNQYNNLVAAII